MNFTELLIFVFFFGKSSDCFNFMLMVFGSQFICTIIQLRNSGKRSYTAINNPPTWKDAQTYCRTYHTDLAMIENAQENVEVMSVMSTDIAWIGLYREPWRWSDNSSSSFTNWQDRQPDNYAGEYCVAESSDHGWHDLKCDYKTFFWGVTPIICKFCLSALNGHGRVDLEMW
uniref:C-type lectin domain-containing protein n=1 Tax=Seriola dumerili TaxID=41447 RepID=A0A3B4UCY1_SERDU